MKKFKNTKLFKWLDKGTKAQAFPKNFLLILRFAQLSTLQATDA